jgi:putative transposase
LKVAVNLPLLVSAEIADSLEGQSKILNWTFNHLLETTNNEKQRYKETLDPKAAKLVYSKRGLRDLLPRLKTQFPFLLSTHSAPLKNTALRLSRSIQAFQGDQKKPKNQRLNRGWPKFRSSKKKFFSLEYDEYANGYQFKKEGHQWFLILSLGKTKEGKQIQHRIQVKELPPWIERSILQAHAKFLEAKGDQKKNKNSNQAQDQKKLHIRQFLPFTGIRITRIGKEWRGILSAQIEQKKPASEIKTMAVIDPNHKNLGYLVDHEGLAVEIQNLKFVKILDQRIDSIQARRDRCKRSSIKIEREDGSYFYKPSRRWKFFQDYLDELRRVRREQIKSALYCISNKLVARYDFIAVGNYTPRGGGISTGMRRAMNNQSQIGLFKSTLEWVYQREGKYYQEWDERNSTKTCSVCHTKAEQSLDPSVRVWQCTVCKSTHIRDENAALNGFKRVSQDIQNKNMPCSGHFLDQWESKKMPTVLSRWTWGFTGSGISVSRASECIQLQPPRNSTP